MTLIIPAGFAQVSYGGFIAGDTDEIWTTCAIELDGALTAGVAEALYDAWSENLDGVSSTDWTFASCMVKAGPNDSGPVDEFTGGTVTGTLVEGTVPDNTALLVRKVTGLGGRANRGRMFMCGQVTVVIVGGAGILDPTRLDSINTALFSWLGAMQAVPGVVRPVLLHSTSSDPTPILDFNPQQKVATQRRRLRP